MSYTFGPDVYLTLVPTGRGAETREKLLTDACPSCGVSWRRPGSVRVGWSGRREYRCDTCGVFHVGVVLDADGHPVRSLGAGLARELREG